MKFLANAVHETPVNSEHQLRMLAPYLFVVKLLNGSTEGINENLILKRMNEDGVVNHHNTILDLLNELMSRGVVYPWHKGYKLTQAFEDFINEQKEKLENGRK